VYLCRHFNLPEVANYWEQVIIMNDYQKYRFAKSIITTLFNTVNGKKIAFLGWAFKKDTNDTRESAAIYVAEALIEDGAEIHVYDPKVSEAKIKADMRYLWELNGLTEERIIKKLAQLFVYNNPMDATNKAHAVAVLTEWDEFVNYDWIAIYKNMYKPAFVFDGRNILDTEKMAAIGFQIKGIGK
jgi:UDPglucose 6-dehydrogenase